MQRPRRELCADGPGSSEARAPVHRVWSPRLNAAKEASPQHVRGRSACPRHPTPCPRRPTAQEAWSRPPRPILHREPGHRWHAASRRQPGWQMLHAPFSLGEPDEPSSPLAGGGCRSRACAGTAGWRPLPPTPPIPPQACLLLASEAGSRGPPWLYLPAPEPGPWAACWVFEEWALSLARGPRVPRVPACPVSTGTQPCDGWLGLP